jgi:hypothetical protein
MSMSSFQIPLSPGPGKVTASPISPVSQQLLLLLLEQQRLEVVAILARRPSVFREFFAGQYRKAMS